MSDHDCAIEVVEIEPAEEPFTKRVRGLCFECGAEWVGTAQG